MDLKEVELPSGAKLKIGLAPFAEGRDLYQAMLSEMKGLSFDGEKEIDHNFLKDLFCIGMSSKNIEEKIWKCMSRCLYNGEKVTTDVFEPVEARNDYFMVMFEVAKENLMPFTKSLYAQYEHIFQMLMKKNPE